MPLSIVFERKCFMSQPILSGLLYLRNFIVSNLSDLKCNICVYKKLSHIFSIIYILLLIIASKANNVAN